MIRNFLRGVSPLLGIAVLVGGAYFAFRAAGIGGLWIMVLLVYAFMIPVLDQVFYGERAQLIQKPSREPSRKREEKEEEKEVAQDEN